MVSPIIEAHNLRKVYPPGVVAVDGIDFSVNEGEIFGLLGPNGAGKSTTIGMLITLIQPTAGTARVCGYDVRSQTNQVRSCVGYVSQDIAVDEDLTGRDNLVLQGHFYHLSGRILEERIREVLEMVGLTERAGDKVEKYSGGMRKRLDIAAGVLHRPRVLFLDEPTLGLDIQTRHRIWEYVRYLRAEHNTTVVLTTHYMEEADTLCDRIAIIDHGKIVALDAPQHLKRSIGEDLLVMEVGQGGMHEQIQAALGQVAGIERVEQTATQTYHLAMANGAATLAAVVHALHEAVVPVTSLTLKSPTLDDVFLHFTGHDLREDEGAMDRVQAFVRMRRIRGG